MEKANPNMEKEKNVIKESKRVLFSSLANSGEHELLSTILIVLSFKIVL